MRLIGGHGLRNVEADWLYTILAGEELAAGRAALAGRAPLEEPEAQERYERELER